MQISATIGNEAYFFLLSILEGVGLVLVYDMFRVLRRLIKHGNIWIGLEDIIYWAFCLGAVFLLLYQKNDGMMRAFSFIGMMIGIGIYTSLFSRFVIKLCVLALSPVTKTGKKILFFLKKQLKKLYKTIRMGLCKL